jgi:hypothetical protein
MNKEELNIALEVWKKMVDVQMHFNEIGLKIRNFALTIYTFILAGIGFLINAKISGCIIGILILLGAVVIFSFYLIDKNWYHIYLKAVGKKAGEFEEKWFKDFPEMKMSSQIASDSKKNEKIIFKTVEYDSTKRFSWFYYPLLSSLILGSLYFFFIYSSSTKKVDYSDFEKLSTEHEFIQKENKTLILENKYIMIKSNLVENKIDSLNHIIKKSKKMNDSLNLVINSKK